MRSKPYPYGNLFPKQREALIKLGDPNFKFVLFGGGAGGGKSWLGCDWIAGMALVFPGTRWFIARKTLKRLKETTYKTFVKVGIDKGFTHLYAYSEQKGLITFSNGSEIQLLEVKRQPSDPHYEDLGSYEFTGGMLEEAGEISFEAFDTLKSRVGRQLNDKYNIPPTILITCNPKKNWLYSEFYKPWSKGELPSTHAFIQSLATDNPHATKEYIENLQAIKNKAKRERLLLGNWDYEESPYQLYPYEAILDTFSNEFAPEGHSYITADIARYGEDKTVICLWNGYRCTRIETLAKSAVTKTAEAISAMARIHGVPRSRIVVDEDGVGGGVADILKCRGFVNNSRATAGNYANLKTEAAFKLQEMLPTIHINATTEQRELIEQELSAVEEKNPEADGKIMLISRDDIKAKIGRSPDYFSALMMRAYFELNVSKPIRSAFA